MQIARQGEEPDAHGIILYHTDLSQDDEITFEVCIPIPRRLPGGPGVDCRELPAARVAFITFRGPYDTIWNAHVELRRVGRRARLRAAGPVREIGIVDERTRTTRGSGSPSWPCPSAADAGRPLRPPVA